MNSGIYQIRNLKNDKVYVGSSVDIEKRLRTHKRNLLKKKHHNIHLQRAFNIDKSNNFKYETLELCDISSLLNREQAWINATKINSYNLCPTAGNTLGRICSKETRIKIGISNKNKKISKRTRKNLSKALKGKKKPKFWIENIKGEGNPFYGKKHTKRVLDIIIKANKGKKIPKNQIKKSIKGRSKPVIQYDLDGNFIREWPSAKHAEKKRGFSSSVIGSCCKKKRKQHKKFIWRYKYENRRTNYQQAQEKKETVCFKRLSEDI